MINSEDLIFHESGELRLTASRLARLSVSKASGPMDIIATTADSKSCAKRFPHDFIAVDTEFMREQTFWPVLCLIQIAGARREAIIDPQARASILHPSSRSWPILKCSSLPRGAPGHRDHGASLGVVPKPIFDTQVAAMVCGFGDQAGYEQIVRKLAKAQIDKSSRFTDWSRRPLSEKQLSYALSDVTHLRTVYEKLREKLERTGREPWLAEEMRS